MKKRYLLLIAAIAVCAGLFLWLLSADGICIGRMENQVDDQWSQLHLYMNDEITVDFPIDGTNRTCLFQYETGRGSFSVEITDARGNVVYSDSTDESGSATFRASSDLKLRIRADGHGGAFSLLQRQKPAYFIGDNALSYGLRTNGTHTGGEFSATYELRQADGKYVNFFVQNVGSGPVVISINGEYSQTIPEGKAGHISAPISASIVPQTMTIKCVSSSDEDINIIWSAAQRHQNTT